MNSVFSGLFPADHGSKEIAIQSMAALRGLTRPTPRDYERERECGSERVSSLVREMKECEGKREI